MYIKKFLIPIIISAFIAAGCDYYNVSLDQYIRTSSAIAYVEDYVLGISSYFERPDGVITIPVNSYMDMFFTVNNIQNVDLSMKLEGEGSGRVNGFFYDNYSAQIIINNVRRLDMYDLSLEIIKSDGRKMVPYKLPKLEGRYFDRSLASFTVNQKHIINQEFDPSMEGYTIEIPWGTREQDAAEPYIYTKSVNLNITAFTPQGVFSTYQYHVSEDIIKPENNAAIVPLDDSNLITLEVIADCGISGYYYFNISIVPPPVLEDFEIYGTGTFIYDGLPVQLFIWPKEGKTQGKITAFYEGIEGTVYTKSPDAPADIGKYEVTFNVAEYDNHIAVYGLYAGTFEIIKRAVMFDGMFTDETIDLSVFSENDFRYGDILYAEVTGDFDYYYWYFDGNLYTSGSYQNSISRTISFYDNLTVGIHTMTVIVTKNGVPYSKELIFKVVW